MPEELKVHDASFLGSQFTLEIDGVELARFQGVGGLSWETEVVEEKIATKDGKVERKSGSIVVYDLAGEEIDRWNFENAWPSKWSASDLDSGSDAVVIEEVTLAVEHMERKK